MEDEGIAKKSGIFAVPTEAEWAAYLEQFRILEIDVSQFESHLGLGHGLIRNHADRANLLQRDREYIRDGLDRRIQKIKEGRTQVDVHKRRIKKLKLIGESWRLKLMMAKSRLEALKPSPLKKKGPKDLMDLL